MPLPQIPQPRLSSSKLFLIGAVGLVLLSLLIFSQLLRGTQVKEKPVATVPQTQPLVVVTQAVPMGQLITRLDVAVVDWPKAYYPEPAATYDTLTDAVGHVARKDLLPGEPLFRAKVAAEGITPGFPVLIPDGMRAVTVEVTDIKSVGGLIKPGDRVDVVAKVQQDIDDQAVDLSKTILQNAQVIAVEQVYDDERLASLAPLEVDAKDKTAKPSPDADRAERELKERLDAKRKEKSGNVPKNITLALWPDDAEKILLVEEIGTLRLVLRPETDHSLTRAHGVTSAEMFRATACEASCPRRMAAMAAVTGIPSQLPPTTGRRLTRLRSTRAPPSPRWIFRDTPFPPGRGLG